MHAETTPADTSGSNDLLDGDRGSHLHAGAWVDLGCTAFALIVDLLVIVAAVHFFRTGFLPGWLDSHGGTWAWFGAGAAACWWVLVETPDALSQLTGAYWQRSSDRLYSGITAMPAEDGAQR